MHNGRLVSLLFVSLIVCQLFLASNVNAADSDNYIDEGISISESVSVAVYRLTDNLPISESLLAIFAPSSEELPISESVSVAVYRLNRADVSDNLPISESVLANKFTPRFENLPISDSLSVTIYRFNRGNVSDNLPISESLLAIFAPSSEDIVISDSVQVHKYSPLVEGVTLSESVLANKFTPSSEELPISESVSVAVHRFNRGGTPRHLLLRYIVDNFNLSEAVLVEKLPPGGENMPISDSVSVTIYRATPPVTPVKPISWWLIGGIIAAVVAIAFATFLLRRRMLF